MSNSTNNQIGGNQNGRMPSDEQMDSLLKDFFRYEVPIALNRPFQRPTVVMPQTVVVAEGSFTEQKSLSRRPRAIVAAALTLLVLSLVVFVQVNQEDSSALAKKKSSQSEDLMLVSPRADAKSGQAVSDDGVTLEETDAIELKAQPKK